MLARRRVLLAILAMSILSAARAQVAVPPTYTQDFTGYTILNAPTGWFEAEGTLGSAFTEAPVASNTNEWQGDDFLNLPANGASARILFRNFSLPQREWIISPLFDLDAARSYTLSYRIGVTQPFGSTASDALADDEEVRVLYSTDGTTWTAANTLRTYSSAGEDLSGTNTAETALNEVVEIPAGLDSLQLAFYVFRNTNNSPANCELFVDDVTLTAVPIGPPQPALLVAPADGAVGIPFADPIALDWDDDPEGTVPTSYDVYFGTTTPPPFRENVTSSAATSPALAQETTYYWQVVPKNANGAATGAPIWSFTTDITGTVTVFPYRQNFDTFPPSFWLEARGPIGSPTSFTTPPAPASVDASTPGAWEFVPFANTGSNRGAKLNIFGSSSVNDWLISPPIAIGSGPTRYQISFDVAVTDADLATADPVGFSADDLLTVLVSTDGGATWTAANTIQQYTAGSGLGLAPLTKTLSLAPYSGTVRVAFQGASVVSNSDFDVHLDNFEISAIPDIAPGGPLAVSPVPGGTNVSETTAVTWTAGVGGTPTGYRIFFGTDGGGSTTPTNIANGTSTGTTSTFDPPGSLAFGTTYYWQVEASNGNGDALSPIYSFLTRPNPNVDTFPYAEDFDPYLPVNWTEARGVASANTVFDAGPSAVESTSEWRQANFANTGSNVSARIFSISFPTIFDKKDWLISPTFDLAGASANYTLSFDLAVANSFESTTGQFDIDDKLQVLVKRTTDAAWSNAAPLRTWTNADTFSGTGQNITLSLDAFRGSQVQVAFYYESITNGSSDEDIFVDNFTITRTGGPVPEVWTLY